MGTWATGIYSDDEAQNARDAYLAILSSGLDGPAATDRFLKEWKAAMKDSDDGPVIWFALADTQWNLGRIEDRVRDAAVRIIDNGSSLDRWREVGEKLADKRQAVLLELKKKLLSPQPKPKALKVRKPTRIATWKPGELFAYRLRSGRLVVLCLECIDEDHHGELSALDWLGDSIPEAKTLKSTKRKRLILRGKRSSYTMWGVGARKKRDVPYDRMVRLGIRIPPEKVPAHRRWTHKSWHLLDNNLEEFFGWS
jgi:hypothetical protein